MAIYNDGNIPFGAQDTVINSVTYPTEEIVFNEGVKSNVRNDSVGLPNGAVHVDEPVTGTMTLQLPTVSTAVPVRGSLCSLTFRGSPKNFYITKVSQPQKSGEIRKLQVEIFEKLAA